MPMVQDLPTGAAAPIATAVAALLLGLFHIAVSVQSSWKRRRNLLELVATHPDWVEAAYVTPAGATAMRRLYLKTRATSGLAPWPRGTGWMTPPRC